MAATISEYEKQRAQRILDNQLRIKELGIREAVAAVRPKVLVKAAPRYTLCQLLHSNWEHSLRLSSVLNTWLLVQAETETRRTAGWSY